MNKRENTIGVAPVAHPSVGQQADAPRPPDSGDTKLTPENTNRNGREHLADTLKTLRATYAILRRLRDKAGNC